ncbi:agglutination protein [Sphingomonas ginkgonis]|uniref:Agglutination protein n=1 Tax=Sphingomonas ginkgonis TaxID=2315330 RepID=A0A3R9X6J7_9SPHN|nr:TolC family protein [Sphingomonas ginkgonis]RST30037.1 agglutination protein [Sphingomonas ginkgonis]
MKINASWLVPGAVLLAAQPAWGIDLKDAVQQALNTNPQVRQAIANKLATQEERRQAQGLWYPRVDVRASAGVRELRNPTRRAIGLAGETLTPVEGALTLDQLLLDAGGRQAEIRRHAARTDAAASRISERSEYVALNVSRAYIDYLLQQRLVAIAQDNVAFHEKLAGDLREGVQKGSISIADQQQAEERLQSARARVTEATEDLNTAAIEFQNLAGVPIDSATLPPDLAAALPPTLAEAESQARERNPLVQEALADFAATRELVRSARSDAGPRLNLEGQARVGNDIDGFAGNTRDLQANVVMRWNLTNGGIKEANIREQQRRADEAQGRLFEQTRRAEQDARSAWNRLENQNRLVGELETQGKVTDDLLLSYREQFNVGRRSLLDVLDAQNTRYNVQAQAESARMARLYAQYRVLAADNRLADALGVQKPREAFSNERERFRVHEVPAAYRVETGAPPVVVGPPAPTGGR